MATSPSFRKVAGFSDLKNSKICTHCHTRITSLWRSGPFGGKSLCNACGLMYQRKGIDALELRSKGNQSKNKRTGTKRIQHQRKVVKLQSNEDHSKKTTKKERPVKVEIGDMLTRNGCWKELMQPQIQQHGEEAVKAAIQLMDLSGAIYS
ncbi:hypothetical protein ACP70R_022704 [Stipagrostis hirtigluma subsp. patula]